jgi:hypothetical protein
LITSSELATMVIRHVIFHDVPTAVKGAAGVAPTLSEVETDIDPPRKQMLKKKLTQVLNSSRAYPVQFRPGTTSQVPVEVRKLTIKCTPKAFVESSQILANNLFEQHIGSVSPGLLCVIDVAVGGKSAIILMKLEREEGAQLELSKKDGKKTYAMSVLDNLVLTDGTRLFKSAMFLRTGKGDDDFRSTACDSQLSVTSSSDVAKFWLKFLGCEFLIEPRVATQQFFDSAVKFVNDVVTDPVEKSDIYDALLTDIKSNKKTFSPKQFIEDHLPEEYQKPFKEHLQTNNIPMTAFDKDISDIETRLRRRAWATESGALVSVPEAAADKVEVTANQIIVNDPVTKVSR